MFTTTLQTAETIRKKHSFHRNNQSQCQNMDRNKNICLRIVHIICVFLSGWLSIFGVLWKILVSMLQQLTQKLQLMDLYSYLIYVTERSNPINRTRFWSDLDYMQF